MYLRITIEHIVLHRMCDISYIAHDDKRQKCAEHGGNLNIKISMTQ